MTQAFHVRGASVVLNRQLEGTYTTYLFKTASTDSLLNFANSIKVMALRKYARIILRK
jgi:hypothetical protein